jgi:small-conductance mechanosensitive channel
VNQLWDAADYAGRFFVDFLVFIVGVLVFATVIGFTVWLGGRLRRWLVARAETSWSDNANLPSLIDNVFRLVVFLAGLVLALGVVGASTDSLVTWIGIVVAALSIAMQDVIKNLVAGFYLLMEHRFGAGDRVVVAGETGIVERVDLRVTTIRNRRQQLVLVPNYLVFSQVVTTRTASESHCLSLTISEIGEEPRGVRQSILDLVRETLGTQARPPEIEIDSIQGSGVAVSARIFLDERATMREQVILAIHEQFPKAIVVVIEG